MPGDSAGEKAKRERMTQTRAQVRAFWLQVVEEWSKMAP